jgi:uncharacterized protein
MNIKHFTDVDMDGVSCTIPFNYMKDIKILDTEFFPINTIEKRLNEYIDNKEYENFDFTYITDLGISYDLAKKIDQLCISNFYLIDHHKSSESLKEFEWCDIRTHDKNDRLVSAAKLVSERFSYCIQEKYYKIISDITELVSSYDTYTWKKDNFLEPKKLQDIFSIYGRNRFLKHIYEVIDRGYIENLFGGRESFLLDMEQDRIQRVLKAKVLQMKSIRFRDYNVGCFFCEQYVSEIGNSLCETFPNIDFVMMFDMGRGVVQMRATKDNIDLSEIVKSLGGGGHKSAAGCPINKEIMEIISGLILNQ